MVEKITQEVRIQVASRRALLKLFGLTGLALPLLQACGAPTVGGGSSAGGASSASTPASSSQAASAAATQAPQSQAAPSSGKISVRMAVRTEPNNEWQTHWAKDWASKHPNVDLKIEQIAYAEMAQKQLAQLATGTMQDAFYSGIKWFPYSAAKGVFLPLDDLIKSNDPGMDDFIDAAIAGCKFEGKLYALPSELQTGNRTQIIYNKDMLDKKGLQPPTDDWTTDDFVELATKLTDKTNKIYGTDFFPDNYYDFSALARTWGGDFMSQDAKKCTFASDPKSVQAAQWAVDLRSKYQAAPSRAESQATSGSLFPSGKIGLATVGIYAFLSMGKTVGDKFKWDGVLFPKGPTGLRGYEGFVVMWSVYSKSKQPDTAFDLVALETSKEVGVWSVLNDGYQPSARKSVWSDPQIKAINSIFERTLEWMTDGKNQGPFPTPYNLRFSELQDKWANTSMGLFYGEDPFDSSMQKVQQECQKIMDLPRP